MKFDIKFLVLLSIVAIPLYCAEDRAVARVASVSQSELENIYRQPFRYPDEGNLSIIVGKFGDASNHRNVGFIRSHANKEATVGDVVAMMPLFAIFSSDNSDIASAIQEIAQKKRAYLKALLPPELFAILDQAKVFSAALK